jgi:hypothetical protein
MQRVLGAQEFTSRLKNKIVAKDVAPLPKYNYVSISKTANQSTLGECCAGPIGNFVINLTTIGITGSVCVQDIPGGCPGSETLPQLEEPTIFLTFQTINSEEEYIPSVLLFTSDVYDFTGTIVYINGVSVPTVVSTEVPYGVAALGPFPANSTISFVFPTPLTSISLIAFLPYTVS